MPVKRRPSGYHDHPLTDEEIANVLEAFGSSSSFSAHHVLFEHPHPVMLNDRTKTARKIFVDTPSDAYFLKQVPWYCDEPSLNEFRHGWIETLYAAGVLVPPPLRTLAGAPCAELGERRYTLARSVVGSAWTNGKAQIDTAMRLLASLHAVPPQNDHLATNEDYFDLVADHITLAQDLLREKGVDISGTLTATFQPRLDDANRRAHDAGWTTLPRAGIHGDFSPWNLMLSVDGRQALACDFDNADFGQRLHDIVESIFSFGLLRYRDQSTNFDGAARFGTIEAAAVPLNAYRRYAPLHDAEVACVQSVSEAFAIEVYCLGLMRGDFDICQISTMVEELERLGRELPQLVRDQPVAQLIDNASHCDRSAFDRYYYHYHSLPNDNFSAFFGDFARASVCEDLLACCRQGPATGESPLLFTGGCACLTNHFRQSDAPKFEGELCRVVSANIDGVPALTTAALGDSQTIVEAILRRMPIDPQTPVIFAVCSHCGANRALADSWKVTTCFNQTSKFNIKEDVKSIDCAEDFAGSDRRRI